MKSYITIHNIRKNYKIRNREINVLDEVDFRVRKNEFVSVVGNSGCGKTTLLKIIGGLLPATSGKVVIDKELPDRIVKHHRLGFVFQDSSLLPWRTAYANVKLAGEISGIKNNRRKIEQFMDDVGLGEFKGLYPYQLSKGMRSRVSIARAFSIEPFVLLMDEPFAHLDEITRQRMNEILLDVWAKFKATAIFVTHNISEAVFLSDRVIVLSSLPATIKADLSVNFPRPRRNDLRFRPEFLGKVKETQKFLMETMG